MQTAASELLTELTRRRIQLVAPGDRLRYRPRSSLTPELAERLKAHKSELLAVLRNAGAPGTADSGPKADDPRALSQGPDPPLSAHRGWVLWKPGEGPCSWCRRFAWWESIHGVVVCGNCHPPAAPELVRRWLKPSEN